MLLPRPQNILAPTQRLLILSAVALILAVFTLTWFSIRESRADSLQLLVMQGKAFSEALSQAAENAIISETVFDYLVHKRYNEITRELSDIKLDQITEPVLYETANRHALYGLYVFKLDSSRIAGVSVEGPVVNPPEFVLNELYGLIENPDDKYILLFDEGETPDETVHFYMEITNELDRVILVVADALYYAEALRQTQIGYLAQRMSKETGVEYIIYHTSEGIIFSSVKAEQFLSIESDPFLTNALEADTIYNRVYQFKGKNVLELVRPFSSAKFPFGLFRVGLSLDGYYSISSGFDRQMLILSGVLAVLLLVILLYSNSRTKRYKIAREFHQMKSVTDKIFDEMKTGVASVLSDGTLALANEAFEQIIGQGRLTGKNWKEVITDREFSMEVLFDQAQRSAEQEITVGRGKTQKTLLVAASELEPDKGAAAGVIVVVYDITTLRDFEQKAARKERLSEMGHLAAGVAHEIRNPLNTISIAAQRLATEFSVDDNNEEYIEFTRQIRQETKRLNDIITRFLALAREEKKTRETVALGKLVKEQAGFLALEAREFGIDLKCEIKKEIEISADPDTIKQVITNLYSNSRDALDGRGGIVRITVGEGNNAAELIFDDSGPGIADDLKEKVFTPYFTTKEAGTGLGLPTVYKIVSNLNGEIWVEQSDLGGARFVINIPKKS